MRFWGRSLGKAAAVALVARSVQRQGFRYNASMGDEIETVRALVPVVVLAAAASLGVEVPYAPPSHAEVRRLIDHHHAPAFEVHRPERTEDAISTIITPGAGSLGITGHPVHRATSTARLS